MSTPPPIRAPKPTPLSGDEVVARTDATVVDFWRFALSNLWMNNARGYLAEFLVARAVGSTRSRIEWDPYDVLAPDGTTIEVKTSAISRPGTSTSSQRFSSQGFAVASGPQRVG